MNGSRSPLDADRPVIRFLTDNNVPDDVGAWLIERGHDVERVRDILSDDAPDAIVGETAIRDDRVLVTWDKDFNDQKFQASRYAALQRLAFSCPYALAVVRLEALMERIEDEHARASPNRPLLFKVGKDKITIRC